MIPLTCGIESSQTQGNRRQNGGCQELRRGGHGGWFSEYRVSVFQDEEVLEICYLTL